MRDANGGRGPITAEALTQALGRNALPLGKKISPHDLRRTAHTHLGGDGIRATRFVRDRIINHADSSAGKSYDLYEYLAEKRTALEAWGAVLEGLVPEARLKRDNVVTLLGGGNG